jgi:hypothetical protein
MVLLYIEVGGRQIKLRLLPGRIGNGLDKGCLVAVWNADKTRPLVQDQVDQADGNEGGDEDDDNPMDGMGKQPAANLQVADGGR